MAPGVWEALFLAAHGWKEVGRGKKKTFEMYKARRCCLFVCVCVGGGGAAQMDGTVTCGGGGANWMAQLRGAFGGFC